jgi:hypothetical protein
MAKRRWLAMIGGSSILLGSILAAAPAAQAGTGIRCFGDTCNGEDPANSFNQYSGTECSSGAWTVHSEQAQDVGGTLELRWGPSCQTNWVRYTPDNNDQYEIWVVRMSKPPAPAVIAGSGVGQRYIFSGGQGVAHWSDQVYSPDDPAAVCVIDDTMWVSTCYQQPS